LKAGTAYTDITPPDFTWMTGMGPDRPRPRGVHDRLMAKVLVLYDGKEKYVLVTVDMNYMDLDSVNALKLLVEKRTTIKGENIRIISSHSHSTPGLFVLRNSPDLGFYENCDGMEERRRELVSHVKTSCRKIAGAVCEADRSLVPAEIGFGRGRAGYNIVRWNKAGNLMRYIPNNAGMRPNQKPLDEMFVMGVRAKITKKTLAVFYTNSAHCICVCLKSDLITADYPSYTAAVVEKTLGGLCMFAPGTIGDQHPRDFDCGYKAAKIMGEQLAEEILGAVKKMKYSDKLSVSARQSAYRMLPDRKAGKRREICTRTVMSAMAINGHALSFWPGEPFGMVTKKVKAVSAFSNTTVIANTDDFKTYFVLEKEFHKYKWEAGAKPWNYELKNGDRMAVLAVKLLKGLKRQL